MYKYVLVNTAHKNEHKSPVLSQRADFEALVLLYAIYCTATVVCYLTVPARLLWKSRVRK